MTMLFAALISFAAALPMDVISIEQRPQDRGADTSRAALSNKWVSHRATVWALRRFNGIPVPRSNPESAALIFGEDFYLGGTASCQSLIGRKISWTKSRAADSGTFTIHPNEDFLFTAVKCRDSDADFGSIFWQAMKKAKSWSISGRMLMIKFSDGSSASLEIEAEKQR